MTTSPIPTGDAFDRLMQTIIDRRDGSADRSYTQRLLSGGVEAIARKIMEEAGELVESAQHLDARRSALPPEALNELSQFPEESTRKELGTTAHFVHETADLLYHLWVMLAKHHVPLEWVRQELDRRAGVSGLDEKSNRPRA
ncbi:MAG: phosphoribosyl-ATP diphosphatase [Planctomycetaceae bacterium]|nr:phosphoribosyl-ATP diphosphatase [Planctomycetaceae bacterium]